jgi:hypothetical protein
MGNNGANGGDADGGWWDDIYHDSNSDQTVIVKTDDNFDRLFIDGDLRAYQSKGWGLRTFTDALVFDGYSNGAYLAAFGDQLQSLDFYLSQKKYVRSAEQASALMGAHVRLRIRQFCMRRLLCRWQSLLVVN